MKKTITILLVLVMVLSLAACGSQSTTGNTPTLDKDSKNETTQELTTEPIQNPERDKAQDFACRYLTEFGDIFVKPLSVKVKQAWYYNDNLNGRLTDANGNLCDFLYITFLLEVDSKDGTTHTVYYGNNRAFRDLTDKEIDDASRYKSAGLDGYFDEDEVKAMQNGEELDAAAIQEYYLKHYK